MKTKSTVLKSVAVLGAVTAAGTMATTTAHADAVSDAASANASAVSTTNADQQLANLKSQQAAKETQAANSNASAMSAATSAADQQIAGINSQIASRQASDAAANSAAVASQTTAINSAADAATSAENASYSDAVAKQSAANNAALKSAQANLSTPAKKSQETAQENASYQNATKDLENQHVAKTGKINADYQGQEQAAQQKITDAQNAAKADHATKLAKATKQVDGEIADATKAVDDVQAVISNDQNAVNAKSDASQKAQATVNAAQKVLSSDQSALDAAQKALKDGDFQATDKLIVPADFISVWKEFNDTSHDLSVSKKGHPALWQRNHDASVIAKKENKDFVATAQEKITPVHFNADGTLSRDDVIIATQYAVELLNPVREAIGENPLQITNASIDMAMENASKYRAKGHNDFKDGHDFPLVGAIANEWGIDTMSESMCGNYRLAQPSPTVADLKQAIHDAVVALLFEGADGSDNGHTADLLGVHYNKGSLALGGSDFMGVTFDIDPVNHNGWIRFNSIGDGESARTKAFLNDGYPISMGTAKDKTIQGSNYDKIAVPTPESKEEAQAKLQAQINKLSAKVSADNNAVKLAQSTASDDANALKTAQDKLAQDQKSLTNAQSKLNNLKSNRDKMIQDLASDKSGSKLIQDLQNQLNTIKTKHADAIKAENADYAAKLSTLKKNHEAKLAAIQAEPENVDSLKAELQGKLDALKKNHEAKLAEIQNDAKTKIEALKKQASENDPEITKLQGQINTIKDNLAKQQKALDDQFAALKAQDQEEYNALEQKLKNSSSSAAKGDSDHYNTNGGHEVVLPGKDDHKGNQGDQTIKSSDNKNVDHKSNSKIDTKSTDNNQVVDHEVNGNSQVVDHQVAVNTDAKSVAGQATSNHAANVTTISYPASQAQVSANVAPMTREAVKAQQNGNKLPQTGNENGIVAMALGAMAAMLGLGFAAKKRY